MQVSVAGGRAPVWSPTSTEILYGVLEMNQGQIMIAPDQSRAMSSSSPRNHGHGSASATRAVDESSMFDIHPDGTRVALGPVIGPENRPHYDHVTIVFNLFDTLHRIVKPIRAPRRRP